MSTVIFAINNDKVIQTINHFDIGSWSYFNGSLIFDSLIYNSTTFATAHNAVDWNQIELNAYKSNAVNTAYNYFAKKWGTVSHLGTDYSVELSIHNNIAISYAVTNSSTLLIRHSNGVIDVTADLFTFVANYQDAYMASYNAYMECVNNIYSATSSNDVDLALNAYMV